MTDTWTRSTTCATAMGRTSSRCSWPGPQAVFAASHGYRHSASSRQKTSNPWGSPSTPEAAKQRAGEYSRTSRPQPGSAARSVQLAGGLPDGAGFLRRAGNFPWRYGRCNTEQGWRTVMAYQSTPNGRCVQSTVRFSSPAVTFRGTPTGDAARRDNRRVLMETARRVANFRQSKTEPPPPPPNSLQATLPYVAPAGGGLHPSLVRVAQRLGAAEHGAGDGLRRHRTALRSGAVVHSPRAKPRRSPPPPWSREGPGSRASATGPAGGAWSSAVSAPSARGMYYRTADGFMAELTAPVAGSRTAQANALRRGVLQPGSNTAKVSRLRLANPTARRSRWSSRGVTTRAGRRRGGR